MYAVSIIIMPIFGGLISYLLSNFGEKVRDRLVLYVTTATFLLSLGMYPIIQNKGALIIEYPFVFPPFGLSFRMDWLSMGLVVLISFVWLLVTVYSFDYMHHTNNLTRYYVFNLITFGATLGTVLAGDLITLFLFFELMSLSSYVLVIHEGSENSLEAGFFYLIMTLAGGLALLFGITVIFQLTGSVQFIDVGKFALDSPLSLVAFMSFLVGFGMKAGMFPLHVWLPKAHPVAPSPASALLSGVMLKIGAYGLIRVMYNVYDINFIARVGWNNILLVIAGITIIIGSILAITQDDIKRRLAYSSVGQMGYILLGIGLISETALVGDFMHIFSHAMMKSCLFLAAGAMILKSGKRNISELKGIGHKMPITMFSFTMAALAMIGIPPFTGFLSKWLLGLGALETGHPIYASLLLISSLLNSIYYFPIIISAYFNKPDASFEGVTEVSYKMLVPIVILAISTVIFDLIPFNLPLMFSRVTASIFAGGAGF